MTSSESQTASFSALASLAVWPAGPETGSEELMVSASLRQQKDV
jgi:hypothetical protein